MIMSKVRPKRVVLMVASGWLAMTGLGAIDVATAAGSPTVEQAGDLGPPRGAPIEDKLIDPPNVPPPIHSDYPARVIVNLETREVVKEIADGARYEFWTFNGATPGPLMRVRQGDRRSASPE